MSVSKVVCPECGKIMLNICKGIYDGWLFTCGDCAKVFRVEIKEYKPINKS